MGKLRQWITFLVDRLVEKSLQRKANKQFMKHDVVYRDGDNT